jgi:cytochrome c-type biogenesis protein CcmF
LRWDTLKSEHTLESFVSRESAFVLQNMLFLAITFAVLWGTVFPLISELVTGTKITVGPPYFKRVTGPLFFTLVLLMGITPLFAWRKQTWKKLGKSMWVIFIGSIILSTGWGYLHRMHPASIAGLWLVVFVLLAILAEFWKGIRARQNTKGENPLQALMKLIGRNQRRYGGYIIHLGVILIALGFIGDAYFKEETQGTVPVGASIEISDYELRFDGLRRYPGSDGRDIYEAQTTLFEDGQVIREIQPRRDYFIVQEQPVSVPGVYATPGKDVYILLVGWDVIDNVQNATFKVYINPLINWVWIGGFVMMFGTIIAAWNGPKQREASYVLKPGVLQPNPTSQEA